MRFMRKHGFAWVDATARVLHIVAQRVGHVLQHGCTTWRKIWELNLVTVLYRPLRPHVSLLRGPTFGNQRVVRHTSRHLASFLRRAVSRALRVGIGWRAKHGSTQRAAVVADARSYFKHFARLTSHSGSSAREQIFLFHPGSFCSTATARVGLEGIRQLFVLFGRFSWSQSRRRRG